MRAGRAKPNWAVFSGGPLDGRRALIPVGLYAGTHVEYTPSAAPGMRTGHEYAVTGETRPGGFHQAKARVLSYLRSLPDEPMPRVPSGSTTR